MSNEIIEMEPKAQQSSTINLADGKAPKPMMSAADFTGMTQSTTALIEAVVQTNLRAMQELLHAKNPNAVLELQQRFVREYMAVLMHGTMTLVNAMASAAAD